MKQEKLAEDMIFWALELKRLKKMLPREIRESMESSFDTNTLEQSDDAKEAAAGRDDAADEGSSFYKASPQAYPPL